MLDQKTIETTVGIAGTMSADVLKISVPRNDLRVTVDGFEIIPFMGLTSWAAFRKGPEQTTVMGDHRPTRGRRWHRLRQWTQGST